MPQITMGTHSVPTIAYLARPARFERTTPAFGGQYSIQLSYGRLEFICALAVHFWDGEA